MTLQLNRRSVCVAAVFGAMLATPVMASAQSQASPFPDRPIRLIVPFTPGAVTDTLARTLVEGMRAALGQPVVVDYKAGAGGLIGTEFVKSAPADGYTLLLTTMSNHIMLPLTQASHFKPESDLSSIGLAVNSSVVAVVSNATPATSLKEFFDAAAKKPGYYNYASAGNGSIAHILTEMLEDQTKTSITHIPYKGSAPALVAVMSNEAQFFIAGYSTVRASAEAGQVRLVAQDGARRSAFLPNVPTFAEAGFPNFQPNFWMGIAAPKQTPPAVVAKLNAALNTTVRSPAFEEAALKYGWVGIPGTPEAMDKRIATDLKQYGAIVRKLNIKAD